MSGFANWSFSKRSVALRVLVRLSQPFKHFALVCLGFSVLLGVPKGKEGVVASYPTTGFF